MPEQQEDQDQDQDRDRGAKWEGKASVELKGVKAEQVWPFLEDFCNIHKYFPGLVTCEHVDGPPGKPGMTRHCTSGSMWARERLVHIDPLARSLTYEVLDNNMGFGTYVATATVTTSTICEASKIEWSFVCDPVNGLTHQDLELYLNSCINFMATIILDLDHPNNCN